MTGVQMPSYLFVCEVGGKHIFLDLARDRYFCLPDRENAAFEALLERGENPPPSSLEALVGAGVLVLSPAGKPIRATVHPLPDRSLRETAAANPAPTRPRFRDLPEVAFLVVTSRRAVRRKALPRALAHIAARDRRDCSGELDGAEALVRRFLAIRPFIPIPPNCLHDSLALCRFLARRRVFPALVIGVKLHPFGAHCWLQDGTTVLNDTLAGAREFQPVLVA